MKNKTKSNSKGRKSTLDKELTFEIRKLCLEGLNYAQIRHKLGICESSWDRWFWTDYEGFRGFLTEIKQEALVKKAEKISEAILDMPHKYKVGNDTVINHHILALKAKESMFIRETLGRGEGYYKRLEASGRNNKKLQVPMPLVDVTNDLKLLEKTDLMGRPLAINAIRFCSFRETKTEDSNGQQSA